MLDWYEEPREFCLSPDEPTVTGWTESEAHYDGVPGFETYVVLPNPKVN